MRDPARSVPVFAVLWCLALDEGEDGSANGVGTVCELPRDAVVEMREEIVWDANGDLSGLHTTEHTGITRPVSIAFGLVREVVSPCDRGARRPRGRR